MIEVNSSVANPELLAAIAAFQSKPSKESEESLCLALGAARFLLPVRNAAEGEDGSVNIDVPVLSDKDGASFPFGFTDWDALEAWFKQPHASISTIELGFFELADFVLHSGRTYSGFAINPGTASQHLLPTRTIAAYTGSSMPVMLEEKTELILGRPNEFPEALGKAVCEAAAPLFEVKNLWLLLKLDRSSQERSFLIIVDTLGGDLHQIFDAIGRAASAAVPSGFAVELLPAFTELAQTALGQHSGLAPFFSRPR